MRLHQISSCGLLHGIGHLEIIIPMIIIMYPILSLVILLIRMLSLYPESPVWLMWIGGDGIKEQFPMTKVQGQDKYCIIFRSLAIQHRKNPNTTWWFRKEDGSQYVPVDNHLYADGRRDVQRAVSIDFTCDIYYANIQVCKMTSFPIVDIP